MNMMFIEHDWAKGIYEAKDHAELKFFVSSCDPFVNDAKLQLKNAKDDWKEWRRGVEAERSGTFAGEAWVDKFGALLIPGNFISAHAIVEKYHVPLGVALKRMKELRPDLFCVPLNIQKCQQGEKISFNNNQERKVKWKTNEE